MGQLTLASGGLCRNWPGSGNGNFWDRTMPSFEKSLARVPGAVVLINHLAPRTEQPKKPWAGAAFPRHCSTSETFPSLYSHSGLLQEQPAPPALRYQGYICSQSSGTSLWIRQFCYKPYRAGLLGEICHFPLRSEMQGCSQQGSWVSLLPAPGSLFQVPPCQLTRMGTVLPSPVAPGQPQTTKVNAYPALIPSFRGREILHQ